MLRSADEQAGCSTFVCPSWFGGLAQKGKGDVGVTADRSSASRSYGTLRACGDDPRSSPRGLVDQRCFWRTSARGLSAVAAEVDLPAPGSQLSGKPRPDRVSSLKCLIILRVLQKALVVCSDLAAMLAQDGQVLGFETPA